MTETASIRVRNPRDDDLGALVAIYNHYVTTSHVTFDVHPSSVEQRRAWFDQFSSIGPHRLLIAEAAARVVGYASSSRFRFKPGYRTSVETTIYLDPEFTGLGIGLELYGALLDDLQAQEEIHRAFAGVALPNPASIALHEKLGFRLIGTFGEVGRKFGRYWSVSWYQKAC